jgi:hypothetical protein
MMRRFVALPGCWFDEGTEARLITDDVYPGLEAGLFEGLHNGILDQEICPMDEFRIEEVNDEPA